MSFSRQVIVDIFRITPEKSWKEMFFQRNFPTFIKTKELEKKTDPNHQQLMNRKNKNKNQICEWEFSL
jgi:hypothetical protein